MIHHGIRLLVALLTFAVGVAAAWLFTSASPGAYGSRDTTTSLSVLMPVAPSEEPPPPPRSCANRRTVPVIAGGIINGKAVSKPTPAYPPAAKEAGVTGTVAVAVVVDESGSVESAEALSGPALLRDAAVEAARQSRFSPTRLSGQPVKVSGTITYNFVLQ